LKARYGKGLLNWSSECTTAIAYMTFTVDYNESPWIIDVDLGRVMLACKKCNARFEMSAETKPQVVAHLKKHRRAAA